MSHPPRYSPDRKEVVWRIIHGENTDDRDLFELMNEKGVVVQSAKNKRGVRRLADFGLENGATMIRHAYDLKLAE